MHNFHPKLPSSGRTTRKNSLMKSQLKVYSLPNSPIHIMKCPERLLFDWHLLVNLSLNFRRTASMEFPYFISERQLTPRSKVFIRIAHPNCKQKTTMKLAFSGWRGFHKFVPKPQVSVFFPVPSYPLICVFSNETAPIYFLALITTSFTLKEIKLRIVNAQPTFPKMFAASFEEMRISLSE